MIIILYMKKNLSKLIPSHITFKLSLLVSVLITVAFTLLEIYNFTNTKSKITQKINSEQYAQAKFIAKDIKEKIDKRVLFIDGLADIISSETVMSEKKSLETLKNHLKITDIFPQGFAILRPTGVGVIAEYPIITGRKTFSFSQAEWFIQAERSQGVVVGTPSISAVNGELLMPMAKAIRDQDGKILGILAAPIFLNSPGFMDYIFDENYKQQGDVLVVSRDSAVFIASNDPSFVLKPTPPLGEDKFHDAVMDGFNGYDQSIFNDGRKTLTAAADINELNWFVIVRTPIDDAYKDLNDNFHSAIVNGILVSIVTLITITFSLFVFFTPLRKAAKSVSKMVRNTQPLTHIKIYKDDEIGDLITGFNLLIDMVNERDLNLKKTNLALESLSQTDGLTGVANRRHFDETLNHIWHVQIRNQKPLTLLLIDIDYFKRYNDNYGHIAGDECLKNVTQAIQATINRPTDFFARYGGEEFVILLQGDIKEGCFIAERARLAVSGLRIEHKNSSFKHLTISLGVASVIPQINSDPVELIKEADQALYQSKGNGRNRYECYKAEGH